MRQRMCLLHNFMQPSLCILTKEQIRIVKFNADFLATMLKINAQIPTGCRNNAQSTQSQSPAILSQSHLGNQKPNPYNLFLHFTNSRFYFQVVIATILAGFATTSCALLLNTNCRFPSLLVNFTLILHPLENWINRTNPVVSYYAKRTCISACAL